MKIKTEPVIPPESVRPDCPEVVFSGTTIGDVLVFTEPLFKEYRQCRTEVQKMNRWIEKTEKQYSQDSQ